jgi:hypothetical protein
LYWQEFWEKGGCAGPLASGDYSTLLEQADICSPHLWADTPLGAAYAALGIKDHIVVPMTPLRGIDRRLGLWRHKDRPDFSERDKALLALVRPHLAELHVRRDRDLWGEPCLTPRQWEVLRHVGEQATPRSRTRSECPSRPLGSTWKMLTCVSAFNAGPRQSLPCCHFSMSPDNPRGIPVSTEPALEGMSSWHSGDRTAQPSAAECC